MAGLPPEPVELGAFRGGAPASTGCNRAPTANSPQSFRKSASGWRTSGCRAPARTGQRGSKRSGHPSPRPSRDGPTIGGMRGPPAVMMKNVMLRALAPTRGVRKRPLFQRKPRANRVGSRSGGCSLAHPPLIDRIADSQTQPGTVVVDPTEISADLAGHWQPTSAAVRSGQCSLPKGL